MRGYGGKPPKVTWPGNAAIAVQFVVNYEEGGENNILHGDKASEAFLSEIVGAAQWEGQRHWNMESIYEYGSRAGFWRLYELFTRADIPVTVYGVATALARSPDQVAAMQSANWEIASHGYKWIEYKDFSVEDEMADIEKAIELHTEVTGEKPRGWYTGRCSVNTVDLISSVGNFDYVSDSYGDDLPYWYNYQGHQQLVIPYTLDVNDMRFAIPAGFNSGGPFYSYLKDTFDVLYAEGQAGYPKMMNIGLHCRLAGRPGRFAALKRFVEYAKSHKNVWFAKRIEIAEHWQSHHGLTQSIDLLTMGKQDFVKMFGGVFEHSSWIAERAYEGEIGEAHNCAIGVHSLLARQFRAASYEERLGVLNAHPDLAGKLAAAKKLTAESTLEQASAGLDALTDEERCEFTDLNNQYTSKFGFPFIIAVKGLNKAEILKAFKQRVENDQPTEFSNACKQVERIALLRLTDLLPE